MAPAVDDECYDADEEDKTRSPYPIMSSDVVVSVPAQNLSEFMALENSYDTWRYVDEASLYSIAEDSREERMSEVASRCGGEADGVGNPSSMEAGWGHAAQYHAQPQCGGGNNSVASAKKVDTTTWSHDDEDTRFSDSDGVVGPCFDSSASLRVRRKRRLIWGSLLCFLFVLLSAAVGVIVRGSKESTGPQSESASSSVQGGDGHSNINDTHSGSTAETSSNETDGSPEGSASPVAATVPPTAHPTAAGNPALIRAYITTALAPCTNTNLLLDGSSTQNLAYSQLLREVVDASTVNSDGYLDIPKSIGSVSLAETFGLMMLYYSTGGEKWTRSDYWLSEKSRCDWLGVKQCGQTNDGTCQVYGLSLENNNLSGDLPEEICCLACLSSLDLSGNNLTSIPSCLAKMNLGLLDLSGNGSLSSNDSGGSGRLR